MRLFLDTSVLLAACRSSTGASREIFRLAEAHHWVLLATPYVIEELLRNLGDFPPSSSAEWATLRSDLVLLDDAFTLDRLAVFPVTKDRPVLFGALAWADVLLTLDQGDFGEVLGESFNGLRVLRPGIFLQREREAGRL